MVKINCELFNTRSVLFSFVKQHIERGTLQKQHVSHVITLKMVNVKSFIDCFLDKP